MSEKQKSQIKPQLGYSIEQIEIIANALNSLEVKGRSNLNIVLTCLQILEQGVGLEVSDVSK